MRYVIYSEWLKEQVKTLQRPAVSPGMIYSHCTVQHCPKRTYKAAGKRGGGVRGSYFGQISEVAGQSEVQFLWLIVGDDPREDRVLVQVIEGPTWRRERNERSVIRPKLEQRPCWCTRWSSGRRPHQRWCWGRWGTQSWISPVAASAESCWMLWTAASVWRERCACMEYSKTNRHRNTGSQSSDKKEEQLHQRPGPPSLIRWFDGNVIEMKNLLNFKSR